jgi:hypothetical protein
MQTRLMDAAINGVTGMVKLQSFFLGLSEILLVGLCGSYRARFDSFYTLGCTETINMLFIFFTFKNHADEKHCRQMLVKFSLCCLDIYYLTQRI